VFSMNRRFYENDVIPAAASTQISTLVAASEFVTAGGIDTNDMPIPIGCGSIPLRIWDQIESFIKMGDTSGNRWAGGVYRGRVFDYHLAETQPAFSWSKDRLVDDLGHPMQPTLIRPDIIVRIGSPFVTEPLSGNEWDKNVYIEEVSSSHRTATGSFLPMGMSWSAEGYRCQYVSSWGRSKSTTTPSG